jgi:hypothetical protein
MDTNKVATKGIDTLKNFSTFLAGIALAGLLVLPAAAGPTSTVFDAAGDAAFPTDLFGAPVPSYLDIVQASVSSKNGVFQFEITMNAQIPMNPAPDFSVSVNHLAWVFGVLTDPKTAGVHTFFGQNESYHFNFLVGVIYCFVDNGVGLPFGWTGFLLDSTGQVAMPFQIRGNTLVVQTSAASLGNPQSFQWVVGIECDPVPPSDEKNKSTLLVDFAPDHDYASWPSTGP